MLIISKPLDIFMKAAGDQVVANENYRLLTYINSYEIDNGLLVYNFMSRELVFLEGDEVSAFKKIDINNPLIKELIERWFFVPEGYDDYSLFKQTDQLIRLISDNNKNVPLTNFVIYPTTDCNARCFYCFELNRTHIHMSLKTATDVGNFIVKRSEGNEIFISWFGGEPLYNYPAIDAITKVLRDNNVTFKSMMVSNGYLFNEEIVEKAKTLWNLTHTQITLDGTEEVYNKVKAYIYKDCPSPFARVIDNIELLLKNGITVNVRLNLHYHNCDDIEQLVDYLVERFEGYNDYRIYLALLYEYNMKPKVQEDRWALYAKYLELNDYIKSKGSDNRVRIETFRRYVHCMADNNGSTTILPDGSLGKCEHYTDDHFYGSIYSDEIDQKNIDIFKAYTDYGEKCHTCSLQPMCLPLKECPGTTYRCDEYDKKLKEVELKDIAITTYNIYKKENKTLDDSSDENKGITQSC